MAVGARAPLAAETARQVVAGTLTRLPAAVPQTFSYLAYFIHLREHADEVVAREWKFNYALDEVNSQPTGSARAA